MSTSAITPAANRIKRAEDLLARGWKPSLGQLQKLYHSQQVLWAHAVYIKTPLLTLAIQSNDDSMVPF